MQIAEITEDIALMLPIIILAQSIIALVVWFAWGSKGGRGARFAAWLGLVTLTLVVGSVLAFIGLHLLLFAFGNTAVVAGVIVTTRVHAPHAVRLGLGGPPSRQRGGGSPDSDLGSQPR